MKRYDLIVIGSGSGGSVAAKIGARLGLRVAIVERKESQLGGNDLYIGSVPSKALLTVGYQPRMTWKRAQKYIFDVTKQIYDRQESGSIYDSQGIEVFFGDAKFVAPTKIKIGKTVINAKKVLVATGARPNLPNIPGLKKAGCETYETIFSKSTLPNKIAIIGGGPVGVEMSFALQRLGASVALIDHNSHVLHNLDSDISDIIQDNLTADGVKVYTSSTVMKITTTNKKKKVVVRQGGDSIDILTDCIVVAAGKQPVIPTGLKKLGILMTPEGISVNKNWRTTNKRIYAVGDVTIGNSKFAHTASQAAYEAVRHAFAGIPARSDPELQPLVFYSDPEVAHVGTTWGRLLKNGKEHREYTITLNDVDRGIIDSAEGMMRIITTSTGYIIGATIVAKNASEIIGYLALAVNKKWHIKSLLQIPLPYPTIASGIRLIAMEAEMERAGTAKRLTALKRFFKR
jgi:pyruvate/2-oxoglutarate dehydrogenase complex dihydrolipoamide dehydrogenase (E3) component